MLKIRPAWVVLTCTMLLSAAPVTISNDISNSQDFWEDVVGDAPIAASFSTGGTAYNLTSVTVVLSNNSNEEEPTVLAANRAMHGHPGQVAPKKAPAKTVHAAADPAASVTVELFSDNSTSPGTLLATSTTTLPDTSLTSTPTQYTFLFSNYPLAAHTRYWVSVVSPGSNSVAEWWASLTTTGTDISTEYGDYSGEILQSTGTAFLVQVVGDPTSALVATPAPSSVILVLIGLGCAALYFRRRKVWQSS